MKTQLDLYRHNQERIVQDFNGKIIAVKDGEVVGEFPSKTDALEFMAARYEPGTFLVIRCTPGDEEYTRRFRTRVQLKESLPA
ncbi:MAG: hypothetical protein DELT_01655 [Desulfovibrio sp.]